VREEAAQQKKEHRAKVSNFFLDILKAVLGGVVVLAVEHWREIISFLHLLF